MINLSLYLLCLSLFGLVFLYSGISTEEYLCGTLFLTISFVLTKLYRERESRGNQISSSVSTSKSLQLFSSALLTGITNLDIDFLHNTFVTANGALVSFAPDPTELHNTSVAPIEHPCDPHNPAAVNVARTVCVNTCTTLLTRQ